MDGVEVWAAAFLTQARAADILTHARDCQGHKNASLILQSVRQCSEEKAQSKMATQAEEKKKRRKNQIKTTTTKISSPKKPQTPGHWFCHTAFRKLRLRADFM